MNYEIRIKRQKKGDCTPYFQTFAFEGNGEETLAAVLDELNTSDDLFDINGNPTDKIIWACSCNQAICGACAMVINGVPALACKTKLNSFKGNKITLEPLSKFPIVSDLETDRTALYQAPIAHGIWNEGKTEINAKQHALEYEASKCMKCGICVEVCPNTDMGFTTGAVFAVDCYLKWAQSGVAKEKKHIKKEYNKNFGRGCSKSMACMENCPAKIDLKKLISIMNKGI